MKLRIDAILKQLEEQLSMEDEKVDPKDAKTEVEYERVFYGQLVNSEALSKAVSVCHQEQWMIKIEKDENKQYHGTIRVRKIEDEDEPEPYYIFCLKVFEQDKHGALEVEFETNEAAFNQIKRLSDRGMIKTRYCFPVAGTDAVWEVDTFHDEKGKRIDWVKIDVELKDPNMPVGPLPVILKNAFEYSSVNPDEDQQRLVSMLYEKRFTLPNQYPVKD